MFQAIKRIFSKRNTQRDPDWWWNMGVTSKASSGVYVNRDKALCLPAVFQSVTMISSDSSKLGMSLYRRDEPESDNRTVYRSHPSHFAVHDEANEEMTARQFWRQIIADMLLFNNGFALIIRAGDGRATELLPLLPDRTFRKRRESGQLYYESQIGGRVLTFDPYDIFHLRNLFLTNVQGNAPDFLQYARDSLGLGLGAQDYQSKAFANGLKSAGVLEVPGSMPKTARDNLEDGFRKKYESGSNSWFKTIVLREGAKYHSISQTNHEAESHVLREEQVREVARLYNLPPSRLGLSDAVSYNSEAEATRKYFSSTLSPILDAICDEARFKLLLPGERRAGLLYFEHNTAGLLKLDLLSRYQAYQIGLSGQFLTINEVRKRENMPSVAWGDKPVEPQKPQRPDDDEEPDDTEYGPNADRDRWLCEHREQHTIPQLRAKLWSIADEKHWTKIGESAIKVAIRRYRSHIHRELVSV